MTEPEPRIAQLIDAYTPPTSGLPDWEDVVRRAARPAARRPVVTGTRILLIAAALAVLLAGSAAAGVGPGRLLLGLVQDDEPAPAPVKHALAHVFRWPHGTHVLLDQSRLVSRQREFTTWRASDRRPIAQTVENWIAPIRDGGYCSGQYFVPGKGTGQGYSYSCIHGPLRPAVRLGQTSRSAWLNVDGKLYWDEWLLDGTVPAAAARVVLVRRDGTATPVPITSAVIGGVRYFAIKLAAESAHTSAGPARIVAYDSGGRPIGTAVLSNRDVRPVITTAGDESGSVEDHGRRVRFGTLGAVFQGEQGTAAMSVDIDPHQRRYACLDVEFTPDRHGSTRSAFAQCAGSGPGLAPGIDTNLGIHVAYGTVPPGVARLQMTLRDGSVVPVSAHNGAYLVVIPDRLFRSGNLPLRLVGRDAGGRVVARYVFSRSRDFPDY